MTLFPETATLLIIDDTPSNLSVVVSLFEDRGYRVSIAQDGEEGMQRAQLLQPDLILLDVMMPGIDGFEACRRLKRQPGTSDIPVIFMTALASAEHKVKGFQAGAVDYVAKPLQIDEVMARVDTHLKLHAAQKKLAEHNEELERRVAERTAELAAREREFRTLAENAPDEIARHDRQCRYFYINPQHERTLGVLVDDIAGKTPAEVFPGDRKVLAYQAVMQRVIETGLPAEYEAILPGGGDGPHYHNIRLAAERGADGEITGVLAIGRDITAIKRAERELHLLNRALDNSFDATYLVDFDLRLRYVNEAAVRELGYSRQELQSMSLLDIDPNVTREMVQGLMQQTAAAGRFPGTVESQHRRKDGTTFPIEIGASTFIYEGESLFLTAVRNITERKEAEQRLHEKSEAIRAVVENSPDPIVRYDAQLRRVYVNPATQRLFGLPHERILGETQEAGSPLYGDIRPMLKQVFESGKECRTEQPFRKTDGQQGWGDLRLVPEFGPDGSVATVLLIGHDVTDRKRSEDALAAREREFRTLAEHIPDTIIRYDAQGRKIYVNTAVANFIGAEADSLIGRTPQETLPTRRADQADAYVANLRHTLDSGEPRETEVLLHHAKLGERVLNVKFVAERDESGEIVGALMVGRDITAMKAIESELMEREQRYREIFDNAVEGMYLLEVTENGRFRNIDVNPALAKSTGIPREAMIGQFVDDTVPGEAARQTVEKYRRCVVAGETITENIELDLPAGKRCYLSTITPIYFGGRIHRLIGISRDITDLKRVQRELEESRAQLRGLTARREETREEERKYIAREVHDELGQILTGLQLNVSVLTHKFAADSPPLREQLKETMMLTDKALGVARNVASALRPAALDMGIASALEWLAGRFGKNTGIQCEAHIEDMDIQIEESQAIALFRIVQESLTNVARHAKAGRVDILFGKAGDDYSLKVRDNGAGFDPRAKSKDSFGLVGMRERALLLGGEVIINSKPGGGTEIEVRIPAHNVSRIS
ncbi:MAG TPA: PAS domain S-box protein [Gallionella sp.]|nr:PAS domain S-box protein [Gallionella sp.]